MALPLSITPLSFLSLVSTTIDGQPTLVPASETQTLIPPTNSTSVPSPSSPPNGGNSSPISTSTASSLYLYTFLATLVLLLAVSAAVVIRSVTIRMRQRRAIEEAIRNGTYVSPEEEVARRRAKERLLSKKPDLFDANAAMEDGLAGLSNSEEGKKNFAWGQLQPVSASFIPSPSLSDQTSSGSGNMPTIQMNTPGLPDSTNRLLDRLENMIYRYTSRRRQSNPILPTTANVASDSYGTGSQYSSSAEGESEKIDEQSGQSCATTPPSSVLLTILIAMPAPPISRSTQQVDALASDLSEQERQIPLVEFGIAEVPIVPDVSDDVNETLPLTDDSEGVKNDSGNDHHDHTLS